MHSQTTKNLGFLMKPYESAKNASQVKTSTPLLLVRLKAKRGFCTYAGLPSTMYQQM
jgi:hypothetical protein